MSVSTAEGLAAARIEGAKRHLFLCLGPDCAPMVEGQATWDHLKRRCNELNLPVMRTKAACFRICTGGPWLLIYPEGIWYGQVTPERCERILQEHVLGGKPVTEWVACIHAPDGKPACATSIAYEDIVHTNARVAPTTCCRGAETETSVEAREAADGVSN
jgi:(2Fe-2S) ferredoxin